MRILYILCYDLKLCVEHNNIFNFHNTDYPFHSCDIQDDDENLSQHI